MIKIITSRKNQIVVDALNLKDQFLIEGEHLLEMALNANSVDSIFTLKEITNLNQNINQYIVTKEILEKLSSQRSVPNVIAVCKKFNNSLISDKPIIYLDKVQDPGNVGTILRSALAFNFKNIIIGSGTCSIYNEKVIQASQGAIFNLNIISGDIELIKEYKNKNYDIIVTSLDKDSKKLNDYNSISNKSIIVFGNEGQGVDKQIVDLATNKLFIEMSNIDSLNVGVAASILMYKFSKKE